jgi:hypothetical protein
MARAVAEVTVVTTVESVTLTLSADEAEALRSVTGLVGGHPDYTARRHIDSIRDALDDVGVENHSDELTGSVFFKAA